ncbi:MAG: hypothetical protein ACYDAL_11780 [Candidatus Dormibacteraceae bacterium]
MLVFILGGLIAGFLAIRGGHGLGPRVVVGHRDRYSRRDHRRLARRPSAYLDLVRHLRQIVIAFVGALIPLLVAHAIPTQREIAPHVAPF